MHDSQSDSHRSPDQRVIMHLDMDAFFVSVELLARPELKGQRVIVARESSRSVVLSASYEARTFGVRSAMPLERARQLCPDATIVEPSANYRGYSRAVMAILHDVTDRVEQVSVDEAFVDLTPTLRRLGNPVDVAQSVRERIWQELALPSSVGISSSKFIAKMASSGSKPNGLWVVPPHRVQEFLDPMPVGKLWGVGPKTASTIESWGIHTVAQLREYDLDFLMARLGRAAGAHLFQIARGIDDRPVVTFRQEKSMGAEHTFAQDSTDAEEISREIFKLSLAVGRRLRKAQRQSRSLSLKIRFDTFETLSRSCLLESSTDSGREIHRAVMKRLRELEIVDAAGRVPRPIRLLGVRAEKLEGRESGVQQSLLDDTLQPTAQNYSRDWHGAEAAMDAIQQKFGAEGLLPANFLKVSGKSTERRG
ncbi:DNA polymerase IV [Rothia aerolata]|uniref:DNA polymerase IV n=1 Tax=Rothia aerolata TaxID=1812262 RepID=UPI00166BAD05|nr:DNA polymerase IV [Rothia aerolata]